MIDIPGYEGKYAVTIDGQIWSYPKNGAGKKHMGKFLKPYPNQKGYYRVELGASTVKKNNRFFIHRIVASVFIKNEHNKEQVNHIDGNKQNNCFSNLEWCTNTENMEHYRKKLCAKI